MAHKHKLRGESCPGGSVHRGVMKKLQVCANFMLRGCVLIALLKEGERGGGKICTGRNRTSLSCKQEFPNLELTSSANIVYRHRMLECL